MTLNACPAPPAAVTDRCRLAVDGSHLAAVEAFQGMHYRIIAAGDSYNDVSMLKSADIGVMFCPPPKMREEFPELPVALNYDELAQAFSAASLRKPPDNIHAS